METDSPKKERFRPKKEGFDPPKKEGFRPKKESFDPAQKGQPHEAVSHLAAGPLFLALAACFAWTYNTVMPDQIRCDTLARLWSMHVGPLATLPLELLHELLREVGFMPRKIWTHHFGPDTITERRFALRWAVMHVDGSTPDARGGVTIVASRANHPYNGRVAFKVNDLAHPDKAHAVGYGPIPDTWLRNSAPGQKDYGVHWGIQDNRWLNDCDAFVKAHRSVLVFSWVMSCYDTFLGVGQWGL